MNILKNFKLRNDYKKDNKNINSDWNKISSDWNKVNKDFNKLFNRKSDNQ